MVLGGRRGGRHRKRVVVDAEIHQIRQLPQPSKQRRLQAQIFPEQIVERNSGLAHNHQVPLK
jgi:hypothetical protein